MKYIRTKDGRITEIKENMVVKVSDDATRLVYKEKPYSCVLNGDDDILKEADTIEELCDEFVIVHNTQFDNGKDIYYRVGARACHRGDSYYDFNFNQIRTGRRNIGGTLYGAIWTEQGLKYVAKMNEKGELELL